MLDVNRRFNLAESTAQDLTFGEIMNLAGESTAISVLKMGYGSSMGLPRLRAAIANLVGVRLEEVLTTQCTALGFFMLAFELCRPGDEAVLVTPCFPLSRDTLHGACVTLRECRLTFDQGYRLKAAYLEPLLNEQTKLVSIATPQNPSGVGTGPECIAPILQLMRQKAPNAYLFVDETYRDATYGDRPLIQSAAMSDEVVVARASVSKAFGAPGLRSGWLTIRDPELRERLTIAKMNLVLSGSTLDETLTAVILENREEALGERRGLLAKGIGQVAK